MMEHSQFVVDTKIWVFTCTVTLRLSDAYSFVQRQFERPFESKAIIFFPKSRSDKEKNTLKSEKALAFKPS